MPEVLYIFCEGFTEETILKRFFQPYWSERFLDCEVIRYSGNGELKTKFASDAKEELQAEPNSAVLCLLDLYEEPFKVYDKNSMSHEEGFEAVREQLLGQIESKYHNRFGAFPVIMELETWILADPQIQSRMGNTYPNPETIEHPAQELIRWKPHYNKRIDGAGLFNGASAKRVYDDNCPHFKLMIDWLINEPEKPDPEVLQRLTEWEELQKMLIHKRDAAVQNSEQALHQGDFEEAIRWDEIARQLEKRFKNIRLDILVTSAKASREMFLSKPLVKLASGWRFYG